MIVPNNCIEILGAKTDQMQEEIDKTTVIIGDFNTPLAVIDRFSRQKISKDVIELKNTVN